MPTCCSADTGGSAVSLLRASGVEHHRPPLLQIEPVSIAQSTQRLLVLEAVQDPGNLGTLLRTAAALLWDTVWLLDGCCDPYNEKALRAARGATFQVGVGKPASVCPSVHARHSTG